MAMTSQSPLIAIFGATGGCSLAFLHHALEAKHTVSVLVRSPDKLTGLLTSRGLDMSTVIISGDGNTPSSTAPASASAGSKAHLQMIKGDIRDVSAVQKTLLIGNTPVELIISGIGTYPNFQWSLFRPLVLPDQTLCEDGMKTVITALGNISPTNTPSKSANKPTIIAMSTTGIDASRRDVPLAFVPFYKWLLASPHEDKERMEKVLQREMDKHNVTRGVTVVRASLLVDGTVGEDPEKNKVRAGEDVVGYTISKEGVGRWMFEQFVRGGGEGSRVWKDKYVSLSF